MKKMLAFLWIAVVPCAFAVTPWDQSSVRAAEKYLRVNPNGTAPDIHQADLFPDGARGFYVENLPPLRSYVPQAGKSAADQMLGQTFCGAPLIVLAKALDSVSALTSGNASILTRTEFEIEDVVRSRSGLQAGQRVSVVRLGGEVKEQGMTLRVADERGEPYLQGKSYFMALTRPGDAAGIDYFLHGDPVPVRAGRIEPGSGRWEKFLTGEKYANMKQEILRVSRDKQCAD